MFERRGNLQRRLRRPLGITIGSGLLLRQLLMLYTVVYFWFDRLEPRFARHRIGNPLAQEGTTD